MKVETLRYFRDTHLNQAETWMESKRNWFMCIIVCTKNLSKRTYTENTGMKKNSPFFDDHQLSPMIIILLTPLSWSYNIFWTLLIMKLSNFCSSGERCDS